MDDEHRRHRERIKGASRANGFEGLGKPGKLLAERLAAAVGFNTREEELAAAEEAVLLESLNSSRFVVAVPAQLPDFIGSEHEIWCDGAWVIKATLPRSYGRLWGRRRFAFPSEYLVRIALTNYAFAIGWSVLGLGTEFGSVRIVTRQPYFKGVAPSHNEIFQFMSGIGFQFLKHRYGPCWWRGEDSLIVYDAEPGNFVKTAAGIIPIDVIVQELRTHPSQIE